MTPDATTTARSNRKSLNTSISEIASALKLDKGIAPIQEMTLFPHKTLSQTALFLQQAVSYFNIEILPHPSDSLYLIPSDFILLPNS
jgi:hypothetical protein